MKHAELIALAEQTIEDPTVPEGLLRLLIETLTVALKGES